MVVPLLSNRIDKPSQVGWLVGLRAREREIKGPPRKSLLNKFCVCFSVCL